VLGSGKGLVEYSPVMERKAVIWLSLQTRKPILRLTEGDYAGTATCCPLASPPLALFSFCLFRHVACVLTAWRAAHHLLQLAKEYGPVYDLNIRVFKYLSKTITGWPGGKASSATTGA
jgi:glucosamine-6-phosphate deaminase